MTSNQRLSFLDLPDELLLLIIDQVHQNAPQAPFSDALASPYVVEGGAITDSLVRMSQVNHHFNAMCMEKFWKSSTFGALKGDDVLVLPQFMLREKIEQIMLTGRMDHLARLRFRGFENIKHIHLHNNNLGRFYMLGLDSNDGPGGERHDNSWYVANAVPYMGGWAPSSYRIPPNHRFTHRDKPWSKTFLPAVKHVTLWLTGSHTVGGFSCEEYQYLWTRWLSGDLSVYHTTEQRRRVLSAMLALAFPALETLKCERMKISEGHYKSARLTDAGNLRIYSESEVKAHPRQFTRSELLLHEAELDASDREFEAMVADAIKARNIATSSNSS